MALQIAKTFTIDAPRAAVWAFLTDPQRVARCLPGAAITDKVDDQTYAGTITIKVGPVTASYKGKVRFESLDEAAGTAEIVGSGQDVKGKGGADMRMHSKLTEIAPGKTEVASTSSVNVTGILAQMGARMIQDVSDQMLARFTQAMQTELAASAAPSTAAAAPAPAPEGGRGAAPVRRSDSPAVPSVRPEVAPLDAVALGRDVAARMAGRVVRRPAFWIAVAAAAAGVYWIFLRSR